MSEGETIAVPVSVVAKIRQLAEEGRSPRVHWSVSPQKMNEACQQRRSEIFEEISEEIQPYLKS